ncbi:MAG: hypothetical protein LGB52_07345, partial [Sulfurovum sp.]|nr:hypothetical protein [Sulfurovum sp.]
MTLAQVHVWKAVMTIILKHLHDTDAITVTYILIIIIIAVISVGPYLTDKGEHTALYKLNKNVYI